MEYDASEWRDLNAYVDGELPDANALLLESRIANDSGLQQELARLRALKTSLAGMRPSPATEDLPRPSRPATRFRRFAAAAAAAVVVTAMTASAFIYYGADETNWIAHARALHLVQSQNTYVVEERYVAQTVSSGHVLEFRAPDLTASRLFLVDIATSRWDGRETIAMHYRGVHGCRLSIVAIQSIGNEAGGASLDSGGDLIRVWPYEGFDFAAIAQGMDRDRFESVADYAEIAIVKAIEANDRIRTAMVENQRSALPCA